MSKKWTTNERATLTCLLEKGKEDLEIAKVLGKTVNAVASYIRRLKSKGVKVQRGTPKQPSLFTEEKQNKTPPILRKSVPTVDSSFHFNSKTSGFPKKPALGYVYYDKADGDRAYVWTGAAFVDLSSRQTPPSLPKANTNSNQNPTSELGWSILILVHKHWNLEVRAVARKFISAFHMNPYAKMLEIYIKLLPEIHL